MGCPDDKANLTTSVERTVRIGLRADESGSGEEYLPPLAPAQGWGSVQVDGIVGDQTWAVALGEGSATLESQVALQFVIG